MYLYLCSFGRLSLLPPLLLLADLGSECGSWSSASSSRMIGSCSIWDPRSRTGCLWLMICGIRKGCL